MASQRKPPSSGQSSAQAVAVTPLIPNEVLELLGPPPLTSHENAALYERMLAQVASAIGPRDYIEWAWVKDLVDLSWDAARARRAKTATVALGRRQGINKLLRGTVGTGSPNDFGYDFELEIGQISTGSDPAAVADLEQSLKGELGLDLNAIDDVAYALALPQIEKLDRLIDNAMTRRDAILREIDRRRDAQARRAQAVAADLDLAIDAEFDDQ